MKTKQKSVAPLIKKAAELLKGYSSFSISTKIPKEWLAQEEAIFDKKIIGAQSIKNSMNHELSSGISKASGLSYAQDGDVRIVFDFSADEAIVSLEFIPIFVFGRYKKLVPGLSQSRWICSQCSGNGCAQCNNLGKNYESVEERIGDVMKKYFESDGYTMHASGREDVDATNTAGRPFVMEITGAKKRKAALDKIEKEIASGKEVEAIGLKIVPRSFTELVTESHFDKEYLAEIEFEKDVGDVELKKIESLAGTMLEQQTPNRVAHRRADLVRKRKVIELKHIKTLDGRHATFLILAEAGTYIKELISGDEGRTKPCIASVLGFKARCKKLAVTRIDDGYLDSCLEE